VTKNGIINARIEETLKKEAERVFENLNLSATTAIALFYRQCVLHNGLPFELKVPASLSASDSQQNLPENHDAYNNSHNNRQLYSKLNFF